MNTLPSSNSTSTDETVLEELLQIRWHIANSSLSQLTHFNEAYIIVAREFAEPGSRSLFANPVNIQRLNFIFAQYYFDAIAESKKLGELPAVWRLCVSQESKIIPAFISLLLGANTHINHDMPLALRDTGLTPAELKHDYFAAGTIFKNSIWKIAANLEEHNSSANFIRHNLLTIYHRGALFLIRRWRKKAWKDYASLYFGTMNGTDLLQKTTKKSRRLLSLAKLFKHHA